MFPTCANVIPFAKIGSVCAHHEALHVDDRASCCVMARWIGVVSLICVCGSAGAGVQI